MEEGRNRNQGERARRSHEKDTRETTTRAITKRKEQGITRTNHKLLRTRSRKGKGLRNWKKDKEQEQALKGTHEKQPEEGQEEQ